MTTPSVAEPERRRPPRARPREATWSQKGGTLRLTLVYHMLPGDDLPSPFDSVLVFFGNGVARGFIDDRARWFLAGSATRLDDDCVVGWIATPNAPTAKDLE